MDWREALTTVLRRCDERLRTSKTPWLLTGSAALALHGVPLTAMAA